MKLKKRSSESTSKETSKAIWLDASRVILMKLKKRSSESTSKETSKAIWLDAST
jgi:hypothetical protein